MTYLIKQKYKLLIKARVYGLVLRAAA